MTRNVTATVLAIGLGLVLAASFGCEQTPVEPACDAGVRRRVCAWNDQTNKYDRGCRMMCTDLECPGGTLAWSECAWNPACSEMVRCVPASSGDVCNGDAGAGETTYYSNDPRCPAPG